MTTLHIPVNHPTLLLTSNQRLHWRLKAERTAYWRQLAALIARRDGSKHKRAHVVVTLTWPDRRRRDVHNWQPTVKALMDGLTDAGMWPDDDDTHLVGPDLRRDPEPGPHALRIDIEELA